MQGRMWPCSTHVVERSRVSRHQLLHTRFMLPLLIGLYAAQPFWALRICRLIVHALHQGTAHMRRAQLTMMHSADKEVTSTWLRSPVAAEELIQQSCGLFSRPCLNNPVFQARAARPDALARWVRVGRLDIERCRELGVPFGSRRGKLKEGVPVLSDSGEEVLPRQVRYM